jgi:transcriptional regulator with XRE-family HTH domain
MAAAQPAPEAFRLANRLRELREREFDRLTQTQLGRALGTPDDPLSPAAISMWENPTSGRLPPPSRLEAYALLFCTPRSFEGGVHMLSVGELTPQELDRREHLRQELLALRDTAESHQGTPSAVRAESHQSAPSTGRAESMWHFPDGSRITLVCNRLTPEIRPPFADPSHLNYVRFAGLADLDSLIDIYGAIRAYNPTSRVFIMAAEDLKSRDVANHLVLIGGKAWDTVMPWFLRIFPVPIKAEDPGDRNAIVAYEPDGSEREFKYSLVDDELVEDVGFFIRGENPAAPLRTLTIIGGITTRGVHGAARCFIDPEMRGRNERYLYPRFPDGSTYCVVMRVPVVNNDPLTPDLSITENRLFEWSSVSAEAK